MQNYYDVLGVDKSATSEDIKRAFRKKAMEHHPDKGGDSEKFRQVSEAYETLSDDQKKSNYDMFGHSGGRQQSHGFDMDDLFSRFGFGFGGGNRVKRGSDLRSTIKVTLEDIMTGCVKKVKYSRQVFCDTCSGSGGTDIRTCTTCGGLGHRRMTQRTPFGDMSQDIQCNNCEGSGKSINNKCRTCAGSGTKRSEEIVDINIPGGVADGMGLVVPGNGNHIRDGQPGDLHVYIEEIKHSKFSRSGPDLKCEEWVTIPEAVLGTTINVSTLSGDISINVESGCESGRIFKINNKGVPRLSNDGQTHGFGDLYVKINVKIPKNITNKEREIYTQLKNS